MSVYALCSDALPAFRGLFADYYDEMDCDEDIGHLLDEYVLADCDAGLIDIAVAEDGGQVCGFVIYQIDSIENEWCLKEGMGTVRELYVAPQYRGRGFGRALAEYAESRLKARGAKVLYTLPAEGSQGFFISLGYAEEDEYCCLTECNFFYKTL